jgi:hypothetical protein
MTPAVELTSHRKGRLVNSSRFPLPRSTEGAA